MAATYHVLHITLSGYDLPGIMYTLTYTGMNRGILYRSTPSYCSTGDENATVSTWYMLAGVHLEYHGYVNHKSCGGTRLSGDSARTSRRPRRGKSTKVNSGEYRQRIEL